MMIQANWLAWICSGEACKVPSENGEWLCCLSPGVFYQKWRDNGYGVSHSRCWC